MTCLDQEQWELILERTIFRQYTGQNRLARYWIQDINAGLSNSRNQSKISIVCGAATPAEALNDSSLWEHLKHRDEELLGSPRIMYNS